MKSSDQSDSESINRLTAKQEQLTAEFRQQKAAANVEPSAVGEEQEFVEQQLREIGRLQALTLHQQWELERLTSRGEMTSSIVELAPDTSMAYQLEKYLAVFFLLTIEIGTLSNQLFNKRMKCG